MHSLEVLEADIPVVVDVGQWEGDSYRGTAKHTRRTWKRRFSTKVSDGYEIDMREGVPFPGKGENSWDMGDDAYYGFGGETIEKAVSHIVAEVQKRRYDGWRLPPLARLTHSLGDRDRCNIDPDVWHYIGQTPLPDPLTDWSAFGGDPGVGRGQWVANPSRCQPEAVRE